MVPRTYEAKLIKQSKATEDEASKLTSTDSWRSAFHSGVAAALREISLDLRDFR